MDRALEARAGRVVTPERAKELLDKFEEDEFTAILGFAFGNYSGGTELENADAHFAAGCDHLIAMKASLLPIIAQKFKD
jgi:hypothetical protein